MTKLREQFQNKKRKNLGVILTTVLLIFLILPIALVRVPMIIAQPTVTIVQPPVTLTQPPVTFSTSTQPQIVLTTVQNQITPISTFAPTSPKIDGVVSIEEWGTARQIQLDHGRLMFQNDPTTLYLVIDLIEDTTNDPPLNNAPWGDFFYLAFDVMADEKIIPSKDLQYSIYPGTHNLGMQKYLSSSSWTGLMETYSQLGAGFGPSMNSDTAHRIWELAISLPEIQIGPGGLVRFGVRTYSQNPSFSNNTPENFASDFSELLEIHLVNGRVDLLILAHENFCDALKPLKSHKDSTGLSTYIQSWQNINKSFGNQGRDEAERIKKVIAFYEKYCQTKYVMLVGDSDEFPVRYTMNDRETAAAFDRAFYVTDLYYADLYKADGSFNSWDSNNNGYFGELHGSTIAGIINVDQVNLTPDIAVGRIPASSSIEVTRYVNKVIAYEFDAFQADWFKKILLIATTDWLNIACEANQEIADSLPGYTAIKQYQTGNPCVSTSFEPTPANINNVLNEGVGFVSYIGHGEPNAWQIQDNYYTINHLYALNNNDKLPIVFAAACGTSAYAIQPPYDGYKDIAGQIHQGTNNGLETFTNIPPQPASIQTVNPDCLAESILMKYDTGAIAYMGCATGAQSPAINLDKYFFESVTTTYPSTLGLMWNSMITKFYQQENIPASLAQPDWFVIATIHQPWKYHLFGDPSLRVGGIMQPILTLTQQPQIVITLPQLTFPKEPITFIPRITTLPPETSPGIPITFNPVIISSPAVTSTELLTTTSATKSIIPKITVTSSETSDTQPLTTISNEPPETTQLSRNPTPGFGPFEALLALLGLLVYIRRRSKR